MNSSHTPSPLLSRAKLRASTAFAMVLATLLAGLLLALVIRIPVAAELPVGNVRIVSERTRSILAETQGSITISCFMDQRNPLFRPISRLLKGLVQASRSVAGAEIIIQYVDPRRDLARASRLVSAGVPTNALFFEQKRRRFVVTLDEMLVTLPSSPETLKGAQSPRALSQIFIGESLCASAISRLAKPFERPIVYWLQGHGEGQIDAYDQLTGYSDIARELMRSGYEIRPLELAGKTEIPEDATVVIIAGATRKIAVTERELMDAFLKKGGRLLYMVSHHKETGMEAALSDWGIQLTPFTAVSPKTASGSNIVISQFTEHICTRNLNNASVVFENATCLAVTTRTNRLDETDAPRAVPLALSDEAGWGERHPEIFPRQFDPHSEQKGPVIVAAVAERGLSAAKDLAYRAPRIAVIGEANFISNSALSARTNANRDFFMNVMNWLSAIDTSTASSLGGDAVLVTGFVRSDWIYLLLWSAGIIPALFFLSGIVFFWIYKR